MIGKTARVEIVTTHSACAICLDPIAKGEHVAHVQADPIGLVLVCMPCFATMPPPRLESAADEVIARCGRGL